MRINRLGSQLSFLLIRVIIVQKKVLVIEDSRTAMNIAVKLVEKAGLVPVPAQSLTEAQHVFTHSVPEEFLCAIVDYNLPDATHGQAIDFCLESVLPTIVITGRMDNKTRSDVLRREVVDYIPKENAQTYDYLSRLLVRLERNKNIGVIVAEQDRSTTRAMVPLLKRHNFTTYEVNSAEETYRLLRENPNIKLVITGHEMEDQHSTRLIANLRVEYPKERLAIISVCDKNNELNSARFIKSGANDFLLKPYCHEEFLCRITQNIELIENVEALTSLANTDFLTGLFNRRYFFDRLSSLVSASPASHAIAMLDLDHFKQINDTYGHDAGDDVLITTARLLRQCLPEAIIARFGGEEFCVFMHQTAPKLAFKKVETFRRTLEQQFIQSGESSIKVTSSIGLITDLKADLSECVSAADELLYAAKTNGRNRVICDIPEVTARLATTT